jgi:hypothetical protein
MINIKYVKFEKSDNIKKKYKAIFYDKNKIKIKTINFGASGYSDYTIHKDKKRKERYINRHKKRENWDNFLTAGSLSYYILWNKETIEKSIKNYIKIFKLKKL